MSTEFNYIVRRKKDDSYVTITESDEFSEVLNSYLLKKVFCDTENYTQIYNLDKLVPLESWDKFAFKSNDSLNNNGACFCLYNLNTCFINSIINSRYRFNDFCVWFDKKDLYENGKEFVSIYADFDIDDSKDWSEDWQRLRKIVKDCNYEEFLSILKKIKNVQFADNLIGFIVKEDVKYFKENLLNSQIFNNLKIIKIDTVEYYNETEGTVIEQFSVSANVSTIKDVQFMVNEFNQKIYLCEKSMSGKEQAKSYISEFLSDYSDEQNSELYIALKNFCKNSNNYDYEYLEDLKNQKNELELLLRFMGENGVIVWNIN